MKKTSTKLRRVALATLTILASVLLLSACVSTRDLPHPENFGTVVDKEIYRGAQPQPEDFELLRRLGVKTILKLNTSRVEMETKAAREAGIRLIHIPFNASEIGEPDTCSDVAKAMEVLTDESNWPIYVHCSRGRDRAGYMVGLYRQIVDGWSWEEIDVELAQYGHDDRLRDEFPQIVRELEVGAPACSSVVAKAAKEALRSR